MTKETEEITDEMRAENLVKIQENVASLRQAGLIGYRSDPLQNVDITSEYNLVIDKKSNLSSAKRKMVCARHAYFQEIEEDRLAKQEEEK